MSTPTQASVHHTHPDAKNQFLFRTAVAAALVVFVLALALIYQRSYYEKRIALHDDAGILIFSIERNHQRLDEYLLSGDKSAALDVDRGQLEILRQISQLSQRAPRARDTLRRLQETEQAWYSQFAQPVMKQRANVDSGNQTVAQLQIFYMEQDPGLWWSRRRDAEQELLKKL